RRRARSQISSLAAGLSVSVAISTASVSSVNKSREDSGWVVHTVEVENQLSTSSSQIRRAESAARGYSLTSEPRFSAEHEAATGTISPDMDKLTEWTRDNSVQASNVRRSRPPVEARLRNSPRSWIS
ncbi:hypothetical protein OY671_012356, partial [Metschnikowia pulcherrima]